MRVLRAYRALARSRSGFGSFGAICYCRTDPQASGCGYRSTGLAKARDKRDAFARRSCSDKGLDDDPTQGQSDHDLESPERNPMVVVVDTISATPLRPRHPEKVNLPDALSPPKPDWILVRAPTTR